MRVLFVRDSEAIREEIREPRPSTAGHRRIVARARFALFRQRPAAFDSNKPQGVYQIGDV